MLAVNPIGVKTLSILQKAKIDKQKTEFLSLKTEGDKFTFSKKNTTSQPAFRGSPWQLPYYEMKIPEWGELTAKEGIKIFENFKVGNYLDIGGEYHRRFYDAEIRKNNLSFLDRITSIEEQKKFINHYKEVTGFPNLTEVSERIKIEFVKALIKGSQELNEQYGKGENYYDVVQAGYDGVCSVGRHKALPGSDLDKAYVIIKGHGDGDVKDKRDVDLFKSEIWYGTDQRILSYNHDMAAFPQVYTERQFTKLLNAADNKCIELWKNNGDVRFVDAFFANYFDYKLDLRKSPKFTYLKQLQDKYTEDYVKANQFYIELCQSFPNFTRENVFDNPTKEIIKNIGFVIETMREGQYFSKFGKMNYWYLKQSPTFQLVNLSQLKALKNRGDHKPKRLAREKLEKEFDTWDTEKQYRFLKALIESACANNSEFTTEFNEYFSRGGKDLFEPLIEALTKEGK